MKEIKYISHILRNFYVYFILFFVYFLIYNFQVSIFDFFKGLFIFLISYSAVYFFNDYLDRDEDIKIAKSNLYLDIKNKQLYWTISVLLIVFGLIFNYLISLLALLWFLILYLLNYLYSFQPFRLRNIAFFKESNIFIIYFVKWFLISEYLGLQLNFQNTTFILFIMASSCAALALSLYKRHLKTHKLSEYFFGFIFIVSLIISCFLYPQITILFLPLLLITIYLSWKYKNKQIPIGKYQLIYFIYILAIYLIVLLTRLK